MGEYRKYAVDHFDNNVDYVPEHVEGMFDTPVILPEAYESTIRFIPFNIARSLQYRRDRYGIHFFLHDYQFNALWTHKEKYRNMLPEFKAVMTPEFSVYADWPKMVQMWNHYRKHLLGAWMQSIGCLVYPTITWGDKSSYGWCFDGEPHHSTVCVSSVGCMKKKEEKKFFMDGYNRMLEVLEPETILFYGIIPDECEGHIVPVEKSRKIEKKVKEDDQA